MSLKRHTGSQKVFSTIKERIQKKMGSKVLAEGLRKKDAKTDSQQRTYKAKQEHQDAHRELMAKRWAFTPSWQKEKK